MNQTLLEHERAPAAVLLLAAVLFSWNAWVNDLWAPDEPYFGEGAREMVVDGQWLVPHVNGEITTDKPPLFFWLIALFSLPFGGVTSLTARLPSILAALGTVALTMRLARRGAGPKTAVLAGVMLVTTHMFWDKARWAQIDSLLCLLIVVAVTAFEGHRAGEWSPRVAGLVFWGASGLAVLAKGPVGVLVPVGIAVATALVDRRPGLIGRLTPVVGPLLFLAIALAWAIPATVLVDGYSVVGAVREHVVERAVYGMHHLKPFWYYARVVPYALLPWSLVLPGALLLAWRRRRNQEDRLLLTWAVFVIVFFSLPTEKRDLYILPAVPAMVILISRFVGAVAGFGELRSGDSAIVPGRRWVTVPLAIVAALLAVVGFGMPFVAGQFGEELAVPGGLLGLILGVTGAWMLIAAARGAVLGAVFRGVLVMTAGTLALVTLVYPPFDPQKSGRELAYQVRDRTESFRASGQRLLGLDLSNAYRPVNFYGDGIYLDLHQRTEDVIPELESDRPLYLLANEMRLDELPNEIRSRMTVEYRTRTSRRDVALLRVDPAPAGSELDADPAVVSGGPSSDP